MKAMNLQPINTLGTSMMLLFCVKDGNLYLFIR